MIVEERSFTLLLLLLLQLLLILFFASDCQADCCCCLSSFPPPLACCTFPSILGTLCNPTIRHHVHGWSEWSYHGKEDNLRYVYDQFHENRTRGSLTITRIKKGIPGSGCRSLLLGILFLTASTTLIFSLAGSSPISSKPGISCHRKRKCPIQIKEVSGQSDDLEIISIDATTSSDSSNDSVDTSNKSRKSSIKVGGDVPRPHYNRRKPLQVPSANFRRTSGGGQPVSGEGVISPSGTVVRTTPLPHFNWADCREVWELMLQKDETYTRNPLMMARHPNLQARMRSILIDWLSEVCEVYKLHRETFYLALDFVDRYLSTESNVPKHDLQLIGITCLLISSKIEEIYPPKLADFSFVTDGACDESDILAKELVILKALNWDLTPMTVNGWLCVYMQLYSQLEKENSLDASQVKSQKESPKRVTRRTNSPFKEPPEDDFMIPDYPSKFYAQIAHLLDLSMLDVNSLQFNYSVIAASALYHFTNEATVFQCTG